MDYVIGIAIGAAIYLVLVFCFLYWWAHLKR